MFIRIKADTEHVGDNVYFVNHNCGVRLIAEYLKMKIFLDPDFELDLCHQCGYLVGMYSLDPTTNGTTILKNRTLYYMVIYQKSGRTSLSNVPVPCVGKNQKLSLQILNQIKRNTGECRCVEEPSLIGFSITGSEGALIERAKQLKIERQFTPHLFNSQILSDPNFEKKMSEEVAARVSSLVIQASSSTVHTIQKI